MDLLRIFLLSLLASSSAPGQDYYVGTVTHAGLVWELAIETPSKGDGRATVDVFSHWHAGMKATAFERRGNRLTIQLPSGLGTLVGTPDHEGLRGRVELPDGRVATARFDRRDKAKVSLVDLTVESDGVQLGATLGLPEGPGPHPGVVFLHGGGDSDRTRPPTMFLAHYLPRFGIACLVYDKRGNGRSKGNWRKVGFEPRARDVLACLAVLRSRPEVDAKKVGLFAGSQGSWVASTVAARDPRLAFVVHHSGPAVPVLEADTYAARTGVQQRHGLSAKEADESVDLWRLEASLIRRRVAPAESGQMQKALSAARQRPWFDRAAYSVTPTKHWFLEWYPLVMDFDPVPNLRKADVPMLWLFGARDTQSDPVRNVRVLTELARDHGKPYDIHVFPKAGHGIETPLDARGRIKPPSTMARGYFDLLVKWIRSRCSS